MAKYTINLLSEELLPKQPPLTLNRVIASWVVLLVIMLVWGSSISSKETSLGQQASMIKDETDDLVRRETVLKAQLAALKPDPDLVAQLENIRLLMRNKKALHAQLTDPNRTQSQGFSGAMTELAQNYSKDISLQNIHISNQDMSFSGVARMPAAVPAWLAGFEESPFLTGQTFNNFQITEDDEKTLAL